MSKIMSSIKTNTDNYKLDEIGCFEKPFGIILESYKDKYSNAFYMVLKFYQCYNTDKYEIKALTKFSSKMQISLDIVNEIFNIKCEKYSPSGNTNEFIENKLMLNNKVLVPGNLKELYYAPQYKLHDHAHLFTIKGFDTDREVYLIVDSMHISGDGNRYDNFIMPRLTLESLYKSSCEQMGINDIYCFSSKTKEASADIYDIIITCINLYESTMKQQPYKEIDYINTIIDLIQNNQNIDSNICIEEKGVKEYYNTYNFVIEIKNTVKYKNVFLSELIANISLYILDHNFLKKLTEKKQIIINKWNKIVDIAITNLYRGKLFNLSEELDNVIEEEEHFKLLISDAKNILESVNENHHNSNRSKDSWFFENNSDSIIKVQDSKVIFEFNTEKLYDFWLVDNSPKYLFSLKENNIEFKVHVNANKHDGEASFIAGIFLRTNSNLMYFYGLTSGNLIRLDQPGVNPSIIEVAETSEDVNLKLRIKDKKCILEYYIKDPKDTKQFFTTSLLDDVCELGLGCKTWDKPAHVVVKFDYIINYI